MAKQIYEVFARKDRKDPLGHVGTIRAISDDFAKVYARNTYDEENWVEMYVVRRDAMVTTLALEPIVDVGGEDRGK